MQKFHIKETDCWKHGQVIPSIGFVVSSHAIENLTPICNQIKSRLYFLSNIPNKDLMALMAFSLINDSSNLFIKGSKPSDALILARSGSVRILCSEQQQFQTACRRYCLRKAQCFYYWFITLKSSNPTCKASSSAERPACICSKKYSSYKQIHKMTGFW